MFAAYRHRCHDERFTLGDVFVWPTQDVVIYNLATQQNSGADARIDAVGTSVRAALQDAEGRGISVLGIPRIGSGLGGLRPQDVEEVLASAAATSPVELHLVTRP